MQIQRNFNLLYNWSCSSIVRIVINGYFTDCYVASLMSTMIMLPGMAAKHHHRCGITTWISSMDDRIRSGHKNLWSRNFRIVIVLGIIPLFCSLKPLRCRTMGYQITILWKSKKRFLSSRSLGYTLAEKLFYSKISGSNYR